MVSIVSIGVVSPRNNNERDDMSMPARITGGVDTHGDVHVAAALDERGALLGVESFDTTPTGLRSVVGLALWVRPGRFGRCRRHWRLWAGLIRHLHNKGIGVVEVDRPNRQRRRRRGKSDPEDAISAARSAQSGDSAGEAKTRDGNVETMRVLRVARNSARKARTQALNQMRSIISTAPDEIRSELRDLSGYRMVERASSYRPRNRTDLIGGTKYTLRVLAKRVIHLGQEIKDIDTMLAELVEETAPNFSPASDSALTQHQSCS